MSLWTKYSSVIADRRWMEDSESAMCLICESAWTVRLRRHHCRVCYRLVCSNCSDHFVELQADGQPQRVCDECFPKLDVYLELDCNQSDKGMSPRPSAHESLFKLTIHSVEGISSLTTSFIKDMPQREEPKARDEGGAEADQCSSPMHSLRYVYFTVSIPDKPNLKTSKSKTFDPHLRHYVKFEESMVVRADLAKACESFLVLQVFDRSAGLLGKCRLSLGDCDFDCFNRQQKPSTHDLPLLGKDGLSYHPWQSNCFPSIKCSVTRMHPLKYSLPMYEVHLPSAVSFSVFSIAQRMRRCIPLVNIYPPASDIHSSLFLPLFPLPSSQVDVTDHPNANHFIPANEVLLEAIGHILHQSTCGGIIVRGVLLCTSHRLVFVQYPLQKGQAPLRGGKYGVILLIPLAAIASTQIHRRFGGGDCIALQVMCKDGTGSMFICADRATDASVSDVQLKTGNCTPASVRIIDAFQRMELEVYWRKLEDSFSLVSCCQFNNEDQCLQSPFNLLKEYEHLGVGCHDENKWRISALNRDYKFCPSYPSHFVVPTAISDAHLKESGKHRSIQRVPVLTWIHPHNGAALCRSSQPHVGLAEAACPEDETLLMSIRASSFFTGSFDSPRRRTSPWHCHVKVNSPSSRIRVHKSRTLASSDLHGKSKNTNADIVSWRSSLKEILRSRSKAATVSSNTGADSTSSTGVSKRRNFSFNKARVGDVHVLKRKEKLCHRPRKVKPKFTLTVEELRKHQLQQTGVSISSPPAFGCRESDNLDTGLSRQQNARAVKLRIIDARPYIYAKGNAFMGKGYEVIERLGGSRCTTLEFANIANIHAVKESYNLLRQACSAARACGSFHLSGDSSIRHFSFLEPAGRANVHVGQVYQSSNNQSGEGKCENWGTMLSESKWFQHLSSVLRGGLRCAEYLAEGDPVLVHCSDGWDRTSQIVALAQVLLDPEYRTISGFKRLLSKDFMSFGHRFKARNGTGSEVQQESPIFVQFLDAVWQVWRQMPAEFEFSQKLLQFLVFCYSSRYTIDFHGNSESEYVSYLEYLKQKGSNIPDAQRVNCVTLWDYVAAHYSFFVNAVYSPSCNRHDGAAEHEYCGDNTDGAIALFSNGGTVQHAVQCGACHEEIGDSPSRVRISSDEEFATRNRTYAGIYNEDTLDALQAFQMKDSSTIDSSDRGRCTGCDYQDEDSRVCGSHHALLESIKGGIDDRRIDGCRDSNVDFKRKAYLLSPNCEVSGLQLWEAVHFNGISIPSGAKVMIKSSPSALSTAQATSNTASDTTYKYIPSTFANSEYEKRLEELCFSQQLQLQHKEAEILELRGLAQKFHESVNVAPVKSKIINVKNSTASEEDICVVDMEADDEEDDFAEFLSSSTCIDNRKQRSMSDSTPLRSSLSETSPERSLGSMQNNLSQKSSNSSASRSMSLFQRHFRYQHPTALFFSPPLQKSSPSFGLSESSVNNKTVSTVSAASCMSDRSNHASIIETATLLEDHYD